MSQDYRRNRESELATKLSKNDCGLGFHLDRTALLVIDPVNDFLSESGAARQIFHSKPTVE